MIAALFVATGGCYFGLPDVDPYDIRRDARLYAGPHAVVAHPPCERWGRYWFGGPSAKVRRAKGDDGGCFKAALDAVRRWGGVLEHPEATAAWATFGLAAPPKSGGWIMADFVGGWTCCVEQGHYGHRARKATWLYVHGVVPPLLKWGPSGATARLDAGYHSAEERARARAGGRGVVPPRGDLPAREEFFRRWREHTGKAHWEEVKRIGSSETAATPPEFRDVLLGIARSRGERTSNDVIEVMSKSQRSATPPASETCCSTSPGRRLAE